MKNYCARQRLTKNSYMCKNIPIDVTKLENKSQAYTFIFRYVDVTYVVVYIKSTDFSSCWRKKKLFSIMKNAFKNV